MAEAIDLVVNCYERTYRDVLRPGFFPRIEQQNLHELNKIAIINNVDDRPAVQRQADKLVSSGELDAYYFVSDHIKSALELLQLEPSDLGSIPYFVNWGLVMVTTPGSPWLMHWDAEIRLERECDWLSPAVNFMQHHPEIATANPNWKKQTLAKETLREDGDFALGYGFSDQLFLARRAELAQPIYDYACAASLRYPLAHLGSTFEKRIDAYMRRTRRMRATFKPLRYIHPENEGVLHPAGNLREKLLLRRNKLILKLIKLMPSDNPCWKV